MAVSEILTDLCHHTSEPQLLNRVRPENSTIVIAQQKAVLAVEGLADAVAAVEDFMAEWAAVQAVEEAVFLGI